MAKILVIANTAWNIYNFRMTLISELQKNGHEVIVAASYDMYEKHIKERGIQCCDIKMNQKGTNPFSDFKIIKQYRKLFKTVAPNIVLSYTVKPNIYASLALVKIKNIYIINNISGLGTLFIKKTIYSLIGKCLYRLALLRSNWVFFQNRDDEKLFVNSKLVSNKKTSVIPGSGVDTEKYRVKRNINKGKKILFVGRLIGDKGIVEFFKASKIVSKTHPDVQFIIVGELGANNKTAISKEVLECYLKETNAVFLGKRDDMIPVYKNADIMVLPSYREGLSKALLEAASMSLPIITTNVPGCKDVVKDGYNGYLCEVKNYESLAEKILDMLSLSGEERIELGKSGRDFAKNNFDEKLMFMEYLKKIN